MTEAVGLCWRGFATALCFVGFGFATLLLRVLVFPILFVAVRHPGRRALLAKAVVHHVVKLFIAGTRVLGVISVDVHGLEKLRRRGLLIVANHPSLLDVLLLLSLVQRADCVVKGSLARNPFVAGPIRSAGFIFNDSAPDFVADCAASIRCGNNLIIFPEGTRTPASGEMRLRRGAATVGVRAGVDLTPVLITCYPAALGKGQPWYRIPDRRPHFVIDIGDDLPVRPDACRDGAHASTPAANHCAAPARSGRQFINELTRQLADHFSRGAGRAASSAPMFPGESA
ncbi:lysophospholipid acyltransferase family protein [soil metagenome]